MHVLPNLLDTALHSCASNACACKLNEEEFVIVVITKAQSMQLRPHMLSHLLWSPNVAPAMLNGQRGKAQHGTKHASTDIPCSGTEPLCL